MKKENQKSKTEVTGEIKNPIIKTQYTAKYYPKDHEHQTEKSLTVPNQSMTILEMVKRHQKGLPVDGGRQTPIYNGEDLIPDLNNMDLADREAYIDSVADHLVEVRARIQAAEKEAASKQKQKEFLQWQKEYEAKIKAEHDLRNTTQNQKNAES